MRARDLMTLDFDFIDGDDTVREAILLMRRTRVHCLIVNPRDEYDAHGIITEFDIVSKVVASGGDIDKARVHQVMTKPLYMVDPSFDVKFVARIIGSHKLTRVPVVEMGKIIGVISVADIIRRGIEAIDDFDARVETEDRSITGT
jgi:CBS domain-containing protein